MRKHSTIQMTMLLALCALLAGVLMTTTLPVHAAPGVVQAQQEEERVAGVYAGAIGVAEPVALGVLDLVITLESSGDNQITGAVDGERTQIFRDSPVLSGVITDTGTITPTFRIDAAPFGRVVAGRQLERTFSLVGEVQQDGNVLAGQYEEIIRGFTPEPLIVQGDFLLVRPASLP